MNSDHRRWPKKGEVNQATGLVFWKYQAGWKELWITKFEYRERKARYANRYKNPIDKHGSQIGRAQFARKVVHIIRGSFRNHGFVLTKPPENILGCSINSFQDWLYNQFDPEMNWLNHGCLMPNGPLTWQVDHIIPLSYAGNQDEFEMLWRSVNLRPMWARDNIEKRNSMPDEYDRRKTAIRFRESIKKYAA